MTNINERRTVICGIVYSKNFWGKPVGKTIVKRYKNQRSRGFQGFGYYIPESNKLTHNTKESRILKMLKRDKKASEVLFHHRYPTSTANVRNACHPFSTKDTYDNNYVLVHNGVLWNSHALKKEHDELGIKYVSLQESGKFNDSEALLYDVARYLEGEVDKITAYGTIAFICIKRDEDGIPEAVYFARNDGNPLHMKLTDNSITLSSVGEGEMIKPDTLYRFDYRTYKLTEQYLTIPEYGNVSYYGSGAFGFGAGNNYYDDVFEDDDRYVSSLNNQTDLSRYNLLKDSDFNAHDAYALGEENLEELLTKYRDLEVKELADTITDKELNEFYELDDEIYYLQFALIELKKEVDRQASLDVFPIPRTSLPAHT